MLTIDHAYYINLDYRTDRRLDMESWLEESGWPSSNLTRISAHSVPGRGHLGCTISHIQTLQQFLKSPYKTCVVFEDDFQPYHVPSFWTSLQTYLDTGCPFDILMIASNMLQSEQTQWPGLNRVHKCFTSSAYVITREFAPRLIQNLTEGLTLADKYEKEHLTKANDYCLDVHWEQLMPYSRWYAIVPPLGRQRPSFSDIDGVYTCTT